ncbi:hypothetical protein ACFWD7_48055 [Streptomyces mirabilis]|uniref:hypothetical protein n=1 Tax=Streptomyces mirabilis TaxID=68239 RepID=UPI0036982D88
MTAPLPSPRFSPTAGLFNTLVAHLNARLTARITELRLLIAAETEIGHQHRTARDFADSDAAGYIDRTGLEA